MQARCSLLPGVRRFSDDCNTSANLTHTLSTTTCVAPPSSPIYGPGEGSPAFSPSPIQKRGSGKIYPRLSALH